MTGYGHARLVTELPAGTSGWNCKPHALLSLFEGQADEAIWIDSDTIVSRDPSCLFDGAAADELIAAEESPKQPDQGTAIRTRGWGTRGLQRPPFAHKGCSEIGY